MIIGDLYNFTNNRIRVLMFDNNEVFYDTVDANGVSHILIIKLIYIVELAQIFLIKIQLLLNL